MSGFVTMVTDLKTPNNKKKKSKSSKYFNIHVITKTGVKERAVCFSPQKRKLFVEILHSKKEYGCELSNCKRSNQNDLVISEETSVKKAKLDYELVEKDIKLSSISFIINESPLHQLVNVRGLLFNLGKSEHAIKDGVNYNFKKGILKDEQGDLIPVTVFNKVLDEISDRNVYKFTDMRVAKDY